MLRGCELGCSRIGMTRLAKTPQAKGDGHNKSPDRDSLGNRPSLNRDQG